MTEGYKVKKIFLWSEQVWPEEGWKPWANTIAYYPLTSQTTVNDMSGNGNHLIQVWNITYSETGASTSWAANNYLYNNSISGIPTGQDSRTYAFRGYLQNNGYLIVMGSQQKGKAFMINTRTSTVWHLTTRLNDSSFLTRPTNGWKCHVITFNGSTWTWYVNNVQIYSWSIGTDTTSECWIFNNIGNPRNLDNSYQVWYFAIISRVRTAQEIADYYNQTKSNYGL